MALVLIVDDEKDLAELIDFNLRAAGLDTAIAHDARSALATAIRSPPDVLVLDLMLPDVSGKELCRQFRNQPSLAHAIIVMLTARGDEPERVEGFLAGADDYVTKPFSVRELVLRVQAHLKRVRQLSAPTKSLRCGPFRLDLGSHRFYVDDNEVRLTSLEYRLIQDFMSNVGRVRTRQMLLAEVWNVTAAQQTRTIDTHVMRLREKLGSGKHMLETIRGVGYRLQP